MYTKIFAGSNPSQIYMDAMLTLVNEGEKCSPRGKDIKELRPVVIEYHNPSQRVTFLKGRVINPFFQLAEALWIVTGRSDVKWLTAYNKSIGQFSDDGKFFNAPYGERLRRWNTNDLTKFILNPIDQLEDVYLKLKHDPDTRQAIAVISNPMFDNRHYTIGKQGKDIACNMLLTFKQRNGKLDLTVYNRSNDLHWGTFGANLCQFATIQETMASWLGVEVGNYFQVTDSLHIYLDSYGAQETDKVLSAYGVEGEAPEHIEVSSFVFEDEPRMSSNFEEMHNIFRQYFGVLDSMIQDDTSYEDSGIVDFIVSQIDGCPDEYWRMTFASMFAYQAHKRGHLEVACTALHLMPDSTWKVSCLRFLSKRYKDEPVFSDLYKHLSQDIKDYIERKGE